MRNRIRDGLLVHESCILREFSALASSIFRLWTIVFTALTSKGLISLTLIWWIIWTSCRRLLISAPPIRARHGEKTERVSGPFYLSRRHKFKNSQESLREPPNRKHIMSKINMTANCGQLWPEGSLVFQQWSKRRMWINFFESTTSNSINEILRISRFLGKTIS